MHLSYPALYALAQWLSSQWTGKKLTAAFTQEKEELLLGFEENQYLRIRCSAGLQFIVPTIGFARSNQNSVTLFNEALGQRVQEIKIIPNDRVICIRLENLEIYLKMFGNRSNVLLAREAELMQLFLKKKDESAWLQTLLKTFSNPPEQTEIPSWASTSVLQDLIDYDLSTGTGRENFLFTCTQASWTIDTTEIPSLIFDPIQGMPIAEALSNWLHARLSWSGFTQEYGQAIKTVQQQYSYLLHSLEASKTGLEQLMKQRDPEELGHLILANVHLINADQTELRCQDLYSGEMIQIFLKVGLSASEQAERFYDKSRKRKAEIRRCENLIEEIQQKLPSLEKAISALEKVTSLKELRIWKKDFPSLNQTTAKSVKEVEKSAWREFMLSGWQIRVGKDAKGNDQLTLQGSKSGDLWLHVKDYSGSHVVIKQQSGKIFPEEIIQRAAQLAVWFSPRRHHNLVAVDWCDRKFVRKSKKMPPGAVLVERAQTILADSPKNLQENFS